MTMRFLTRTPKTPVTPKHRAMTANTEYETWVSSHTPSRTEVDYSSWVTTTHEVAEECIYEARAVVKDEGGLITRSVSNRPGKVLLTVMTPPAPEAAMESTPVFGDDPADFGVFL